MPARPRSCSVTKREADVLNLLSQGMGNEEIGIALGVRTSTIKHLLSSAAAKLHVHSRVLLAKFWECEVFRIGAGSDDFPPIDPT